MPSLDFEQYDHRHCWDLVRPEGASAQIPHQPRLVTDSAETLHAAALEGLGVVKLGLLVGARDIQAGRLVDVITGWEPRGGILHAIFPSRRGLLPAVRALRDFLDEQIAEEDFATLVTP
ncbi:hypothetical protein KG088_18185 [Halomonas sp. TRM85114]|uniref:LysR substrate-binding domain-containing protein n=1 Tax=Halomonas jincaotanensis TaxID=2810616 RepID=UPI001BD46475|nr:hypothetical protein [Halomonas jincaotanensis]